MDNGVEFDMDEFVYSYMLDLNYNNNNILIDNFLEDYSVRLLSTDYSIVLNKDIPIRFVITSYDVIHS
ncbi:MAG: hypothetical protein HRT42_14470 [Campylobacteraceae bacterium]|nr:hypothetical protein [Campylobacteraceae bacterium]